MKKNLFIFLFSYAVFFTACKSDDSMPMMPSPMPLDPDNAERVMVDRFSENAATLFVRNDNNGLPADNEAINFDEGPFITHGLGPNGEKVQYYNFDVQPVTPAPIYVLFREGESMAVEGQLNIINVIPGDQGYNDFWLVNKVTVPSNYVANTVTSTEEIMSNGYDIKVTEKIVNCPVVPEGSTASKRLGEEEKAGLIRGWYKNKVVSYFTFEEKSLMSSSMGDQALVPISDIFVTFNINPNMDGGGPASGFVMEENSLQTHNVIETIPMDEDYSPLWSVSAYDNEFFSSVRDWPTAMEATVLGTNVALVNCPVVVVNP